MQVHFVIVCCDGINVLPERSCRVVTPLASRDTVNDTILSLLSCLLHKDTRPRDANSLIFVENNLEDVRSRSRGRWVMFN